MSEPFIPDEVQGLEPVHEDEGGPKVGLWTRRLVLFLRAMAAVSMLKGLYHWTRVCGIGVSGADLFEYQSIAWQTATIFFAVIDLVAAVGLWLAAAWGAVIWLMSVPPCWRSKYFSRKCSAPASRSGSRKARCLQFISCSH